MRELFSDSCYLVPGVLKHFTTCFSKIASSFCHTDQSTEQRKAPLDHVSKFFSCVLSLHHHWVFRVTFHKSYTPSECKTLSVLDGFWLWFVNWFFWYFKQPFIGCWRGDKSSPCAFSSRRSLKWNLSMERVRQNRGRIVDIIAFDSHVELIQSGCFFSIQQLSSTRWRECSWKSRRRRRKRRRSMPKCSLNNAIVNNSDKQRKLYLHGKRRTQTRRL